MHTPKTIQTASLATVLLFVTLTGATPAASFHHDDLPIIHHQSADGSAAFGLRVDQDAIGDIIIDLETTGPATASQVSIAAAFFDQNRDLVFMIALTSHSSPDRLVVSPAPLLNVEYGPGFDGATTLGQDVDYVYTTAATDDACTFACLGLTLPDAAAGAHHYIVWGGGVTTTDLTIRSATAGATAITNAGPAHVLGDPELEDGTPNVQAQESLIDARAGAKAMHDASYAFSAAQQVWGFWGASDFKLACQFALVGCIWSSQVVYECQEATGLDCRTTRISYQSPDGGDSGRSTYGIHGGAPGAYAFTVDLKVDVYGPNHYDPQTGTWVFLGENYSFLTVGEVDLPA